MTPTVDEGGIDSLRNMTRAHYSEKLLRNLGIPDLVWFQ